MFKKNKCNHCGEKISKNFDFCPYCGVKVGENSEDYGFLGKNDFESLDMKLPFGFGAMLKPLMKELSKQMAELDRELKQEDRTSTNVKRSNFSIHFSTPGHKPVKIESVIPGKKVDMKKKVLHLPKFSQEVSEKFKRLKKIVPETSVRRLSDRVIYELNLLGVNSFENLDISSFENSFEIKAVSDKNSYFKEIEIDLPLIGYSLEDSALILEFALSK
jgi:hypothetical protein